MYINSRSSRLLANIDLFAQILPHIKYLRVDGYIEIELPVGSTIYGDKVLLFFKDGCKIRDRGDGKLPRLRGFLKDAEIYEYLRSALYRFNQLKENAKR